MIKLVNGDGELLSGPQVVCVLVDSSSCGSVLTYMVFCPQLQGLDRLVLISNPGYFVCLAFHPVCLPKSYCHSSLVEAQGLLMERCCFLQCSIDESDFLLLPQSKDSPAVDRQSSQLNGMLSRPAWSVISFSPSQICPKVSGLGEVT